jgi:hypothetical protein
MSSFQSGFDFGQCVFIDKDLSLKGYVTGFCWKSDEGPTIEVSWLHNGTSHSVWLQPWRLEKAL